MAKDIIDICDLTVQKSKPYLSDRTLRQNGCICAGHLFGRCARCGVRLSLTKLTEQACNAKVRVCRECVRNRNEAASEPGSELESEPGTKIGTSITVLQASEVDDQDRCKHLASFLGPDRAAV